MSFLFCSVLFCFVLFCFVFCFRSNFRAITRLETQVTHTMEWTTPGRIVNTSEKEYRYTAIAKNREAEKCLRVLRANSALVTSRTSLETQLTENFVEIVASPGWTNTAKLWKHLLMVNEKRLPFFYRINNWRLRTAWLNNRSVDSETETAGVTEQFFRLLLPALHLTVTSLSQSEGDFTDVVQLLVISLSFLLAKTC